MNMESIRVALRALAAHPLRSLLTMLGIIIGVAAVITMVAVGSGAQVQIAQQIRTLGANLLMVQPEAAREGGARLAGGTRHTLTDADAEAIGAEVSGVASAAPSVRGTAQIIHGNRNWNTTVNGTTPDYFLAREWTIAEGRGFSLSETRGAAKVALLGATVADSLFGDQPAIGAMIRILGTPFEVVGVLEAKGTSGTGRDQDDVAFVPISTARLRLMGGAHQVNREAVNYVLVKAVHEQLMGAVENDIRLLLRDRHGLSDEAEDDFRVWNPVAAMAAQQAAARTFSILLAAVASISLIVGGISIMNIMLVSVTERTREIGLRLAVGARRRDIRSQFLTEAVILCIAGGAIGVTLGIVGAITVAELSGWATYIGLEAIVLAVGFAALVGVFFGFYPALKASRLDPIEALRFE